MRIMVWCVNCGTLLCHAESRFFEGSSVATAPGARIGTVAAWQHFGGEETSGRFKRIILGGIGLAIVLLAFLAVPMLWLRNVDHALTASAAVDVCAYLTDTGLTTLPPATSCRSKCSTRPGESKTRAS